MEWVTITAATIEDAKTLALDQLGVANEDADIEVLEEPKPGLFGRLRGEATVRARVRPTSTRDSARRERGAERSGQRSDRSRGDRSRSDSRGDRSRGRSRSGDASGTTRPPRAQRPERNEADRDDNESTRRADGPKVPATTVRDAATTLALFPTASNTAFKT